MRRAGRCGGAVHRQRAVAALVVVAGLVAACAPVDPPPPTEPSVLLGDGYFGDIAFDGARLWIANASAPTVNRINAPDVSGVGQINVGSVPRSLAFDGTNMWVLGSTLRTPDGIGCVIVGCGAELRKVRPDGLTLQVVQIPWAPTGMVVDGNSLWIAHGWYAPVNQTHYSVTQHRITDGAQIAEVFLPDAPREEAFAIEPMALAGTTLWVATTGGSQVQRIRTTDATLLDPYAIVLPDDTALFPWSLATDGSTVWAVNNPLAGGQDPGVPRLVALDADGAVTRVGQLSAYGSSIAVIPEQLMIAMPQANQAEVLRRSDMLYIEHHPDAFRVAAAGGSFWILSNATDFPSGTMARLTRI